MFKYKEFLLYIPNNVLKYVSNFLSFLRGFDCLRDYSCEYVQKIREAECHNVKQNLCKYILDECFFPFPIGNIFAVFSDKMQPSDSTKGKQYRQNSVRNAKEYLTLNNRYPHLKLKHRTVDQVLMPLASSFYTTCRREITFTTCRRAYIFLTSCEEF